MDLPPWRSPQAFGMNDANSLPPTPPPPPSPHGRPLWYDACSIATVCARLGGILVMSLASWLCYPVTPFSMG